MTNFISKIFYPNRCERFFTYESTSLDIKGLKSGIKGFNFDVGSIKFNKKIIQEKKEDLKKLDLLQYSLCKDIQNMDKSDPGRNELLKKSAEIKMKMLALAGNVEISGSKSVEENNKVNSQMEVPVIRIDFDFKTRCFKLVDNDKEVALFIEKSHYLYKKSEAFCVVEICAKKTLWNRKEELEKRQTSHEVEKEIFENVRLLDSLTEFENVLKKKLVILFETEIPELNIYNNILRITSILRNIIDNHILNETGVPMYYSSREWKSGETKLEIYNNLKDLDDKIWQIGFPIYVVKETIEKIYERDSLKFSTDLSGFLRSLTFPNTYYMYDLLDSELITKKVIPRYVEEIFSLQERYPLIMEKNKKIWTGLSNYYLGLG